jgi:hypothetical protein
MEIVIPNSWSLFCIAFAIVLATSYIMGLLGRYLYTRDVSLRKFSIMDLQLAPNAKEIVILVNGIYKLSEPSSKKVIRALRLQLYIDFLFMPGAYGSIFILCMQLSSKMPPVGATFFSILAWLQAIAWLCDIIENIYLLGKIHKDPAESSKPAFKAFQYLEVIKWGSALFGLVCGLAALMYFWFAGDYARESLQYLLIIGIEIAIFFAINWVAKKTIAKEPDLPV